MKSKDALSSKDEQYFFSSLLIICIGLAIVLLVSIHCQRDIEGAITPISTIVWKDGVEI